MTNNVDQFNEQNEQAINWRELFEKYVVYWKWVLTSVIFFSVIGFIYLRTKPNTYQLQSSILIVDQSRSGGMNEMSLLKQLDLGGMGNMLTMVNNENEVIKSVNLMKLVVKRLGLHTSYTTKHYLKPSTLYTESPYQVTLDSLSHVNLEKPLNLKLIPFGTSIIVEGEFGNFSFSQSFNSLPALYKTPAGVISIAFNNRVAIPDSTIEVSIYNVNAVARQLATKVLSTSISKQVDVINLDVEVSNVQMGKDILNALTHFYNQDAIDQLNRSANNTKLFIDERLKLLTNELSSVERSVEDYKQVNELTDVEVNGRLFLETSKEYEKKQVEVETQLSLVRMVEDFMAKPQSNYALIPNLGLVDVTLVATITQYNELLMTRERVSGGSSKDNPALQNLNRQLDAARMAIRNSIAQSRKGLELTKRELQAQNLKSVGKIRELPRIEREYVEIKRQQQVKEALYVFLLQKREEASLSMVTNLPKGNVLNSPEYAEKTGPRSKEILALFLIMGIGLPLLIVFIKDLINTTISSRGQLEKLSNVPILSELGHNATDQVIINHMSNSDSNAELFRLLRTKLQFTLDYPRQKVLLITSTEPGEGKSYVSINLALSLSMTGKKVMLMGMDLRKPQLKKHLMLTEDYGMSAYLSGQEPMYRNIIQKIAQYPNLDVIAAGVIPPNPNELLMSERLEHLVDNLKTEYDYIVIDTAPVGAVSDTFLIDRIADLALYIVRMDYSDKRNLEYLNHIYEEKTLKRPYIVINDINMENKYYYHRGYSYGYGRYYGKKINELVK